MEKYGIETNRNFIEILDTTIKKFNSYKVTSAPVPPSEDNRSRSNMQLVFCHQNHLVPSAYLVNFPWRGAPHERAVEAPHEPLLLRPGPPGWPPPHGLGAHRPGHVPPPHAHGQPNQSQHSLQSIGEASTRTTITGDHFSISSSFL